MESDTCGIEKTKSSHSNIEKTCQVRFIDQFSPVNFLIGCPCCESFLGAAIIVDHLRFMQADTITKFNTGKGELNLR